MDITPTTEKKVSVKKTIEKGRYIRAVGRRKTSTASVKISEGKGHFVVNGKDVKAYFVTDELFNIVSDPFAKGTPEEKFDVTVTVKGGGIHSQAEAVRHAISRILVERDEELRVVLKQAGYLKRDPRAKERRKFGLKKARKAPQWSKR
jgi:small subunit ribosomal protein S9